MGYDLPWFRPGLRDEPIFETVALANGHVEYRTPIGNPADYGSTCTPAKSGLLSYFTQLAVYLVVNSPSVPFP